jgi:hypothetical protein
MLPQRIFNLTLINHPAMDADAAQEALGRVQRALTAEWNQGDIERLSPAAYRLRVTHPVTDDDSLTTRQAELLRALTTIQKEMALERLSPEAARLLHRSQLIYSGTDANHHVTWGVTVQMSGERREVRVDEQPGIGGTPLFGQGEALQSAAQQFLASVSAATIVAAAPVLPTARARPGLRRS